MVYFSHRDIRRYERLKRKLAAEHRHDREAYTEAKADYIRGITEKAKNKMKQANLLWTTHLTILGILCFPVNPLVLSGLIEAETYRTANITGWVTWLFGMALVLSPIILFPGRGGVPKGKSFVHTSKLVDTGIYRMVRHPQYLGGILALFVTTALWYPHPLLIILGILGTVTVYVSCRIEDRMLVKKFGTVYKVYMGRVPRLNLFLGFIRTIRSGGR